MSAEILIFWGAGATRDLGMRLTADQGRLIKNLVFNGESNALGKRVDEAVDGNGFQVNKSDKDALIDLLNLPGDEEGNDRNIDVFTHEQIVIGRKNWSTSSDEEIKKKIIALRLTYDWPALKSLVRITPGYEGDDFDITDLLNIIDMHAPGGFGVNAVETGVDKSQVFLDQRRLIGAKNMLRMLIGAIFYIDYQSAIKNKKTEIQNYIGFFKELGKIAQFKGTDIASRGVQFDEAEFYKTDINFISLNYDPLALWYQFIAHRNLNKSAIAVGDPAVPIELFNEMGHMIPSRRIQKEGAENGAWYPMNEPVAQRMNEKNKSAIRLTKVLFPHGNICWRECPNCGKLSSYLGDSWDEDSAGLIPPPPLRAFDQRSIVGGVSEKERKLRECGHVDARRCLHCETMTYALHTQTVMQSSFKSAPPSFIEEIQRDLRAIAMKSNHIIFMGYSLPADDVSYRAFFSVRKKQLEDSGSRSAVRCSIVVGKDDKFAKWMSPSDIKAAELEESNKTIKAAIAIFGAKNVRFYGGGIPGVFMDGNSVSRDAIDRLLKW